MLKNNYTILFFSIFCFNYAQSQAYTTDCSKDSMKYDALSIFLDTNSYEQINFKQLYFTILDPSKTTNTFCLLLTYSKIFDFLLVNGLDLNYSISKNPPITNSIGVTSYSEEFNKLAEKWRENNAKYKLFHDFLLLKEKFENDVIKPYRLDKNNPLEKDVLNIIHYGTYSKPTILRDILLSKYDFLTRKRMWQELEAKK